MSNGTKNAQCPGSATVVTSLINDTNFDQWMVQWLKHVTSTKTEAQMKKATEYVAAGGEVDAIKTKYQLTVVQEQNLLLENEKRKDTAKTS